MKIAIIGSGISGLTASYHLNKCHDITLFEAESWVGGHTHTVKYDGLNIDTGFIVFNDKTYPNFQKMLDYLKVRYIPSEMSFSVRNDACGLEYNGSNLNSLFSDRRNLVRPKFYRLLCDILKFNKLIKSGLYNQEETLGSFIKQNNFSNWFSSGYILPIASAIWSMGTKEILDFPLHFFAKFFINHGLLEITNRPQWLTIAGGSSQYIEPLTQKFKNRIHLNSRVENIIRHDNQISLSVNGQQLQFDKVILACHSDQALSMLNNPSSDEVAILSKIKYSNNEVVLHTDTSLLPRKKRAHASWNYLICNNSDKQTTVTYNMNILQKLNSSKRFFCSFCNEHSIRIAIS